MRTRQEVILQLNKTEAMPSPPALLQDLMEALADPDTSLEQITRIVEEDVAISTKLLSLANSAVYKGANEIETLKRAAVRIGLSEIKNLALFSTVAQATPQGEEQQYSKFWLHSLSVAYTSRILANRLKNAPPGLLADQAFTAGLIHDMGVLPLIQNFPEEMNLVASKVIQGERDSLYIEEEVLGTNHSEVGSMLATRWRLPHYIIDVAHYHHTPWACPKETQPLAYIVHLADFACTSQFFGRYDVAPQGFDATAWNLFEVQLEDVPEIIEAVLKEGEKSKTFVSLQKPQRSGI